MDCEAGGMCLGSSTSTCPNSGEGVCGPFYLRSKVVCFVLFVMLKSPKPLHFVACSCCLWKALDE